ncbi:MAG: hypothetical protein WC810_23915 [Janthinobacterium sp.]|jgi:hypothetical protein
MTDVTIRVAGVCTKSWELEVTGSRRWVEKMIRKYVPLVQRAAGRLK